MSNPGVFLDVSIDDGETKRIAIELWWVSNYVRRCAERFRSLCTGEKVGRSGNPLSYKGSSFNRVIPGFMCQGGDLAEWEPFCEGEDYFAGENHLKIDSQYTTGPGIVVMSKNNGSQFFICTGKTFDWLDLKKHVVVGRVVKGMDVVKAIEKLGSSSGKTKKRVVIADCGQL